MAVFFALIARLCGLVMIAVLADLLLPSGGMRKYVRLVCGLLLLHIMMAQVFAWLRQPLPALAPDGAPWPLTSGTATDADQRFENGQTAATQAALRQLQTWAESRARASGLTAPEVGVALDQSGGIVAVRVIDTGQTSPLCTAEVAETLKTQLAALAGLSPTAVIIQTSIQKEGEDTP